MHTRKLILFITCNLAALLLCAQASRKDTLGVHVLKEAQKMGRAIVQKDFSTFIHYSHPRQIELMGGEEAYFHFLQKNFYEMEQGGSVYAQVKAENVSTIISAGAELQCTLTQQSDLKVSGGLMRVKTTVIGISMDRGKHWYFTDTDGKDLDAMRTLLPSLSHKLVVPPPAPPEFIQQ